MAHIPIDSDTEGTQIYDTFCGYGDHIVRDRFSAQNFWGDNNLLDGGSDQ